MLKLNGGLGTSMGLEKAKSLLEVKDGKTFLDLIAEQVKYMRVQHGSTVPFILMNSFSTSEDTRAFLAKAHADLLEEPHIELLQNMSPKVDAATFAPATHAEDAEMEWCVQSGGYVLAPYLVQPPCGEILLSIFVPTTLLLSCRCPPGHGDIYSSLLGSGMLDALVAEGVKYLFVSNSDNLGATLDLQLLQHFAATEAPFMMEVCERTAADKKGGHLARRKADGEGR